MNKFAFLLTVLLVFLAIGGLTTEAQPRWFTAMIDDHQVVVVDLETGEMQYEATEKEIPRLFTDPPSQVGSWSVTQNGRVIYGGCPQLYNRNAIMELRHTDGRTYEVRCVIYWEFNF